jgi:tetratricopeptide (TPR) repeat protein
MNMRAVCFVDMPFGKKPDLTSGVEVDFDQVYETAIKPAILDANLEAVRGDGERTGGIIHAPMFGRLLLSEYVVADLTLSNPNVFYELGIRHTARPFTTVPIYAALHAIPFDVSLVRAISYKLEDGKLTPDAAAKLRADLGLRLKDAIQGAASKDSPIFQLIPNFPAIELPPDVTEIFQDKVRDSEAFRKQLADALARPSDAERLAALLELRQSLGNLKVALRDVLMGLLLSLRSVSGWDEMIRVSEEFPDHLKTNAMVRQQRAFALNRRNGLGDREEALRILEILLQEKGADPETLGILGRVHKDRYKELKERKSILASAALDDAIDAYTKGFESDPRDYYPGVNAITLLIENGDPEYLKRADRLVPLVLFAVARRGGISSSDYWDLATALELSAIGSDWATVIRVLPKALAAGKESWKIKTTLDNLLLLNMARERAGQGSTELRELIPHFRERYEELRGQEAKTASVAPNAAN